MGSRAGEITLGPTVSRPSEERRAGRTSERARAPRTKRDAIPEAARQTENDIRQDIQQYNNRRQRRRRETDRSGFERAQPPSQSVSKNGRSSTDEGLRAGAFHSRNRPFGLANELVTQRNGARRNGLASPEEIANVDGHPSSPNTTIATQPPPSVLPISGHESGSSIVPIDQDLEAHEDEYSIESTPTKPSKRFICSVVAIGVVIIVSAVATAVTLSTRQPESAAAVSSNPHAFCESAAILEACQQQQGSDLIIGSIPEGCLQRYSSLRTSWITSVYPNFDFDTTSCHAANQALFALVDGGDAVNSTSRIGRFVLSSLYLALNGHRWRSKDRWLTSSHECNWYGVRCGGSTDEVTEVDLIRNLLSGTLPSELGLLTRLGRSENVGGCVDQNCDLTFYSLRSSFLDS